MLRFQNSFSQPRYGLFPLERSVTSAFVPTALSTHARGSDTPVEYAADESRGNEWIQSWSGSHVRKNPSATSAGSSGAYRRGSQRKIAASATLVTTTISE